MPRINYVIRYAYTINVRLKRLHRMYYIEMQLPDDLYDPSGRFNNYWSAECTCNAFVGATVARRCLECVGAAAITQQFSMRARNLRRSNATIYAVNDNDLIVLRASECRRAHAFAACIRRMCQHAHRSGAHAYSTKYRDSS